MNHKYTKALVSIFSEKLKASGVLNGAKSEGGMVANDRQVDGDHYKRLDYETWDFITDICLPYLIGNAVKYISRYRTKNGARDLLKAVHYIEKAREREIYLNPATFDGGKVSAYLKQFDTPDAHILDLTLSGHYDAAYAEISYLIESLHGELLVKREDTVDAMAPLRVEKGSRNEMLYRYAVDAEKVVRKKLVEHIRWLNVSIIVPSLPKEEVDNIVSSLKGIAGGS